jgi:hypothetical protein
VTVVKIQSTLAAGVADVLAPLAEEIYHHQGGNLMVVAELHHADRNDPIDEDIKRTVTLRVTALEVARGEQEETLRNVQRALYAHRTASGTLSEDYDIEVADSYLRLAAESLHAQEAIRLRLVLADCADRAGNAAARLSLNGERSELLQELRSISTGLRNALDVIHPADEVAAARDLLRHGSGVHVSVPHA